MLKGYFGLGLMGRSRVGVEAVLSSRKTAHPPTGPVPCQPEVLLWLGWRQQPVLQITRGPVYSAKKHNLDVLGVEGMLLGFMHLTLSLLQGL